ncbi:hypothetical protein SeLEV6574_g08316, partial [Synchytrium endobioticum]
MTNGYLIVASVSLTFCIHTFLNGIRDLRTLLAVILLSLVSVALVVGPIGSLIATAKERYSQASHSSLPEYASGSPGQVEMTADDEVAASSEYLEESVNAMVNAVETRRNSYNRAVPIPVGDLVERDVGAIAPVPHRSGTDHRLIKRTRVPFSWIDRQAADAEAGASRHHPSYVGFPRERTSHDLSQFVISAALLVLAIGVFATTASFIHDGVLGRVPAFAGTMLVAFGEIIPAAVIGVLSVKIWNRVEGYFDPPYHISQERVASLNGPELGTDANDLMEYSSPKFATFASKYYASMKYSALSSACLDLEKQDGPHIAGSLYGTFGETSPKSISEPASYRASVMSHSQTQSGHQLTKRMLPQRNDIEAQPSTPAVSRVYRRYGICTAVFFLAYSGYLSFLIHLLAEERWNVGVSMLLALGQAASLHITLLFGALTIWEITYRPRLQSLERLAIRLSRIAGANVIRDDVGLLEGSPSDDIQQLSDTGASDYHPHVGTVGHATDRRVHSRYGICAAAFPFAYLGAISYLIHLLAEERWNFGVSMLLALGDVASLHITLLFGILTIWEVSYRRRLHSLKRLAIRLARIAEATAVRDDVGRLEGSASDDLQQLRDIPVTDYHPHVGTVGHATDRRVHSRYGICEAVSLFVYCGYLSFLFHLLAEERWNFGVSMLLALGDVASLHITLLFGVLTIWEVSYRRRLHSLKRLAIRLARIAEAAAVRDDVGRLEGSPSDDLQQLRDTPVTDY